MSKPHVTEERPKRCKQQREKTAGREEQLRSKDWWGNINNEGGGTLKTLHLDQFSAQSKRP